MSASGIPDWPASHLHAADTAFVALTRDPAPLALDCDSLSRSADLGLPAGTVALPALRDWLLHHPRAYAGRDAVWQELVLRARLYGKEWTIAAVGMAMPALVRIAAHHSAGYRGDSTDIDNEILTGFLEAVRDHADLTRPALYASLTMAAWRAGRRLRLDSEQAVPIDDIEHAVAGSLAPMVPYGHPDLLVHRAVTLNVINEVDMQPWIEVRLGRRAPEPIATRLGISTDALRMRLARADADLARAVTEGTLSALTHTDQAATKAKRSASIRAGKAPRRSAPSPATAVDG
ncbi:hypothetical protein [Micromonospora sp. WMMD1082]|uniref:hypothetical protein n=1 Tax=Micromonospora sp. WMMD1082 TaxID=3016104 RepID=UPI00241717B2|nr:hypothetical protein [Micromonospora sp. WMMD1082]MDG4795065.1 hypothetical protein [Micromonospora sp. WMMD1082]